MTGEQSGDAYLSVPGPFSSPPPPPLCLRHSSACSIERREKRTRLSRVRQADSLAYIKTVLNRAHQKKGGKKKKKWHH